MYLTFEEYRELGGALTELDFNRQEYAARKEIDLQTFNRLQGIGPIPDDLKMCVLELVQRGLLGDLDGQDFTSQSSGRLSSAKEDRHKRIGEIIRRYLEGITVGGVPVFYSGN
jgi:hypothetical protein